MNLRFPYRYRILVFLFSLIFITYLDRICISLVSVRITTEFHLTNTQWGWVLAAFSLSYALFEIPAGIWGDKIGQRAVFIRIVFCWSLFTALTGLTTGFISLLLVRFLFGIGEAGAFPNSSGVISRWFPANETGLGVSSLQLGLTAGGAIAPLIVVPIAVAYGWRASFFVNGAIGLLWVLVCIFWFRNNPSEMKHISAKEKDLIEKNRRFTDHKMDFPWKKALSKRGLWALLWSYFFSQWATYFFVGWMPKYLQEGRHFSENEMKIIAFSIFACGFLGALTGGFAIDWLVKRKGLRVGRLFVAVITLVAQGASFLICAVTSDKWVVAASMIAGSFFWPPNIITSFSTCVDIGGNRAATVASMMNFFGQTGAFFLAILFGKIVDATHSFNAPLYMLTTVMLASAICWLMVTPDKPLITKEDSVGTVSAD